MPWPWGRVSRCRRARGAGGPEAERGAGGCGGARARAYSVKLKATCFSTAEPERRGGAQDHSLTLSAQVHTEPSERVRRDPVKYISAICISGRGAVRLRAVMCETHGQGHGYLRLPRYALPLALPTLKLSSHTRPSPHSLPSRCCSSGPAPRGRAHTITAHWCTSLSAEPGALAAP